MPGSTFVGGAIDIHVRFEALGGNARRAQIFRRHEDLQRAYEHQVKGFARETRHVTSKLSRIQSEHLTRMKAIQKLEPQSFREEWPPLEERRAIVAQMQDGLPLLTGASLSKHASPSKSKDITPTKQRPKNDKTKVTPPKQSSLTPKSATNKVTPLKQNHANPKEENNKGTPPKPDPQTSKLNGMLSKPHFIQPKSLSEPSFSSRSTKTTIAESHSAENNAPQENPKAQQAASQGQIPPEIILSQADHSIPHLESTPSSHSHPGVFNSTAQPPGHLQKPGMSSTNLGLSLRGDTNISSNRGPRRRWRSRQPWGKHESVLLFKIEARDGKETHTQIAQRKYPSYI